MYDTLMDIQMLRTLNPGLLSYDAEHPWTAGTRRGRATRPHKPLTTRRMFGLVPRFASVRARST